MWVAIAFGRYLDGAHAVKACRSSFADLLLTLLP